MLDYMIVQHRKHLLFSVVTSSWTLCVGLLSFEASSNLPKLLNCMLIEHAQRPIRNPAQMFFIVLPLAIPAAIPVFP